MENNDNSHNVNIHDIVCIQTILWSLIHSNILLYIYIVCINIQCVYIYKHIYKLLFVILEYNIYIYTNKYIYIYISIDT